MSDVSAGGGPTPEALGRTIKLIRTRQSIGRAELAELAELSYPYVSEIENGKKEPSTRALGQIATALGLRVHELLAYAEAEEESSGLGAGEPRDVMLSARLEVPVVPRASMPALG